MSPEFKAGMPPTGPGKTKLESEIEIAKQKLAELGYTLERVEHIDDQDFLVYRKPVNLDYPALSTIGIEDSELQKEFSKFLERFNKQAVLIDGFDNNHQARSGWYARALSSTDAKRAHDLKHRSKLSGNFISIRFSLLNILRGEITDENKKSKLTQKIEELKKIKIDGTKYPSLSLLEKIEYADQVDEIFIEAMNLLFKESPETLDK